MDKKILFSLLIILLAMGGFYLLKGDFLGSGVRLYYYSPEKDMDENGNILCSEKGLSYVKRDLESENIIEDTIKLLLSGDISEKERGEGITTEFPLDGFTLTRIEQEGARLNLVFNDKENKTSGGACRVGVLWAQIEATASQFEGIEEVTFDPETLFQP